MARYCQIPNWISFNFYGSSSWIILLAMQWCALPCTISHLPLILQKQSLIWSRKSLTISKYYSSAQSKLHHQKCNYHIWLSINLVPYLFSTDKYAHSATSSMRIRGHGRLGLIKYQFVFNSIEVTDSSCFVKAWSGTNGGIVSQQFPLKNSNPVSGHFKLRDINFRVTRVQN